MERIKFTISDILRLLDENIHWIAEIYTVYPLLEFKNTLSASYDNDINIYFQCDIEKLNIIINTGLPFAFSMFIHTADYSNKNSTRIKKKMCFIIRYSEIGEPVVSLVEDVKTFLKIDLNSYEQNKRDEFRVMDLI